MTANQRSDRLLDELRGLHPMLIDLALDRIKDLLAKLGDPQLRLPPVIHVAGTNGKGSVTAFLVAMLQAAGLRAHAYTSPHLVDFHERIAVPDASGKTAPISEDALCALLTRVRVANANAPMTFFEITTAAAFLAFAEIPADVVVLEVGLGGRMDATNVIDAPAVTVITQIAIDHADKLGATLALIATEKAGIMKPGRPVIVGPQESQAFDTIEARAQAVGAPMTAWGVDFDAYTQNGALVFQQGDVLLDLPLPALRGRHQISNAGTAVAAARALAEHAPHLTVLNDAAIAQGLQSVHWPARMMSLSGGRLARLLSNEDELWLDGGHNPAAGQAIAQTLADLEERAPKPTFLVCGMMAHKDVRGYLEPFQGLVREIITVPVRSGMGPALEAQALADVGTDLGIKASTADGVETALRAICADHGAPRRIMICGSLYLAGDVLAYERGTTAMRN